MSKLRGSDRFGSLLQIIALLQWRPPMVANAQPDYCSANEVIDDRCIFRLDGVCDHDLPVFCDVGSDCYDCDPCLTFDQSCESCTSQSYCGWCSTGTGVDFCLSLGFVEALPALCSSDGGTDWNVGTCSDVRPSPPSGGVPPSPPSPTPPQQVSPIDCDYSRDSCLYQSDGVCDAGTFCRRGTDCFDCDPCQELRLDGCDACTASGCFWCAADAICLSTNNPMLPITVTCQASDFTQTCGNEGTNGFDDPLVSSQTWWFEQMNLQEAWDMGYTGNGVGIRINDDGVDSFHPEFEGRFVTSSSCSIYRPVSSQSKHGHGTAVASLSAGSGNDGECGVGVAPGARISGCRVILTDIDDELAVEAEDDRMLYLKMDGMDISQNSYGSRTCTSLQESSRRLQSTCPFASAELCSRCSSVDWSNPAPNRSCETSIAEYCSNRLLYQEDAEACSNYVDLFVRCDYNGLDPTTSFALNRGITRGRDGKGIIYVFASGNDYDKGADVNFEGTLTSRFTISVGATGRDGLQALYSTGGTALFVSAPGGDLDNYANHVAAAPGGGCRGIAPGTSFSSPLVSGVIALVLEANPELTWRDVQGILATTSRRHDGNDKSWVVNGAGNHHSYLYGFGVVDAGAAVKAAETWTLFSAERQIVADSGTINLSILDFPNDPVSSTVKVTNGDFIVESINIYMNLRHSSRGHLEVVLVSPYGTESIMHPGSRPENSQLEERWKLMTVRSWGERAEGEWSLRLVDKKAGNVDNCVDLLGWTFDFQGLDLTCESFRKLDACSNGGKGSRFDIIFGSISLLDPRFAGSDGLTPGEACCECGGGEDAADVENMLRSWQLVLYGRTVGDDTPGRSTPSPLVSIPGPTPLLTVPDFPTNEQPSGSGQRPVAPVVTVPTTVTAPTFIDSTTPSEPSPNSSFGGRISFDAMTPLGLLTMVLLGIIL